MTGPSRTGATIIGEAAAAAPTGPATYLMLDRLGRLVYVGKASDLRRRLRQHAEAATRRKTRRDVLRDRLVREVRWIRTSDVDEAERREADLVVAFQPVLNAALAIDGRWMHVVTSVLPPPARRGGRAVECRVRFRLVPDAADARSGLGRDPRPARRDPGSADRGLAPAEGLAGPVARADEPVGRERTYGCFAHLGVGVSSRPAIATSEGYAALCRLVWAACEPDERAAFPGSIAGPSPPTDVVLPFADRFAAPLHRFLAGTGAGVLDQLLAGSLERRSPVTGPGLRRDRSTAEGFFTASARPLRDLRLRHGLPPGPLDRATIIDRWAADLEAEVGVVDLRPIDDPTAGLLGARAGRQRAVRSALRRRR